MKNLYVILTAILLCLSAGTSTAQDGWEQLEPMSIAKGGSRSCVIDDKIYVFGGTSSIGGTLSSAEVYNTGTNIWSELTPVPVDLDYTNAGVIDGKIYLAGGWHQPGYGWVTLNTTYAYDPITDSWETKKECPKKSGDNASCVLNGKLYLFGGLKDFPYNDASGQKDALVYDPETDTWDTLADMIYGRADGATACVHNGQIYVFGGLSAISANESQIIGKTEKYDPEENTWTELAEMPIPMVYHISLEYEGKLYLFGGDSTFNPNVNPAIDICTNFIQEYNPLTNEWRLMEGMPFNRGDMTGQKVGDFAYIIGGYPENARDWSSVLSEVWRFNLDSLKEFVTTPEVEPAWMLMNSEDPGGWTCIVDSLIYSFGGGWEGWHIGDDVKSYNTVTNEWNELTPIPMPWAEGNIGLIGDKIYLAGGWTGDWVVSDPVLEYDPSLDSWTSKNKCPATVGSSASCVMDNKLYILGGWEKFSSPEVYRAYNAMIYDPTNDLWDTQSLPDMNYPHLMHATAEVLDGDIYVIGGVGLPPDTKIQPSEKFDGEKWVPIAEIPVPVTLHKSIVHNNKIIVFGGDSLWTQSHSYSTNFIQEYDPATNTWTIMEPMPFQRSSMFGGKVGNYVFMTGGYMDDRDPLTFVPEVWRFNLDSLKVDYTVGIAKTKTRRTILVYPNPANDILHIKDPAQFKDEFEVKMFTITGKMILQKIGYIEQIDISGIPTGIYLISVQSNDFVSTQKIIKQ